MSVTVACYVQVSTAEQNFDRQLQSTSDYATDDLGFWFQHRDDLERYVIVGDSRLVEWVSELGDRLVGRCSDKDEG